MATVTLRGLGKSYREGSRPAVHGVDLMIGDGEFMVLLGPSGCGKSTTLRMIAGLEGITEGELLIDGAPMNAVAAKDRDIAMVFQSYALYPHMNVYDNMAFGLRRRGFSKTDIDERVLSAAEILGLNEYLKRKPHALSGGQRQRVALGRAIVRHPKVFLFDEPLSNLDAALRVSTRNELIKLHRRLGATMIYVTHDQVEAMSMGSRIAIMQAGELVQVGPPMQVYAEPANMFVARFLGSPPMNLISGVLESAGGLVFRSPGLRLPLPFSDLTVPGPFAGQPIVLGVRPEDVYEAPPAAEAGRYARVDGIVAAVEALGAETLVSLQCQAGETITARVPRTSGAVVGQAVGYFVDSEEAQLFDPATSLAIGGRRAVGGNGRTGIEQRIR